jgi:phosphoribosyl 1,2-cyclic phosphate phosphodiesterase
MSLKATILGCGTSGGVPRIGGEWGACDPRNPKNRRRRCALLVEQTNANGVTRILVDTPPDLREQLIDADVGLLDAVLYTHDHADHVHGIDDLRMVAYNGRHRIDVYFEENVGETLGRRFAYCFEKPPGSEYPPVLNAHTIAPDRPLFVEGPGGLIEVMPFKQNHGSIDTLGFRFGGLAYSPDVHNFPDSALQHLEGLDVWIVDALRYTGHPSHLSVAQALGWIERVKPKRSVLTHMHVDLDYDTLAGQLPEGCEPAYDGMVISL